MSAEVEIAVPGSFSLEATLQCGQAFRWIPVAGGAFRGIVEGRVVEASQRGGALFLRGASPADAAFWSSYFSLDVDYGAIEAAFATNPVLRKCLAFSPGIRILRQGFYETLVSCIISQNNNIPRIMGIVDRLCRMFGEPLADGLYAFPPAGAVAAAAEADLAPLRAGYRTKAILDASRRVASGELGEAGLRALPIEEVRARLLTVYGVGPKVAECVGLFGLGRLECFPVDVWIRRAMDKYFPRGLPRRFRPVAGVAQQYLFAYIRAK
jgi:N-glycosylase/DNA lyase